MPSSPYKTLVCVSVLLVLTGCAAVREARKAQGDAEPKSRDDHAVRQIVAPPGENSPGVSFSLPECVAYALTNRPSVVAARLAVDDARLRLRQIAADAPVLSSTPWNALDVSLSAGYAESGTAAHRRDFRARTDGAASGVLSLDLLVYDFGRNAADARAQAERVIAAEQSLVAESYTVFREVADASFVCRRSLSVLEAAETNDVANLLRLEQTERRLAEGEARNLDLLRAKLDHARARESLIVASNEVFAAFAELRHALGVPAHLICPDADLTAVLSCESLAFAYDDPVMLARTNAPSMRVARARLRAASAEVDRAVADLYPTVTASASLSWTDPLWLLRWGGNAVQSLFQGFRTRTALERATVALKAAESEVASAEQDLMRSLELAMTTRDDAREGERAARESLAAAEENLSLVSRQFELGEADRIDYTDALAAVADARGSLAKALCYEQQAEAALFVLTGTPPVYTRP